jgi:Cu2+-exporting ATPase
MVQVVAARRLFERGIMVKDGGALERLAEADHVVFDKTGTLTKGVPRLVDGDGVDPALLAIAAAMARQSHHPYSQAIAALGLRRAAPAVTIIDLGEHPGCGLEGPDGKLYRLGRPEWARPPMRVVSPASCCRRRAVLCRFSFEDELRSGARDAIAESMTKGLPVEILSGDHEEPVRRLAASLDVPY